MRKFFLRLLQRLARRFDCELQDRRPLDLRGVTESAIEASYLAGSRPFIIEAGVADCRSAGGFKYYGPSCHPYTKTLLGVLDGSVDGYVSSPLEDHHNYFHPKNAAETLCLKGRVSERLLSAPPHAFILPWEVGTIERKSVLAISRTEADNKLRGKKLSVAHGFVGIGPLSIEKGNLEFDALVKVLQSIQQRGFRRHNGSDGDIIAVPLINENNVVRYLVRGGKHRIAAVAALGYNKVPVRLHFRNVARAVDRNYWPQVRNGLYTEDQAMEVFSFIFDGDWDKFLRRNAHP